MMISHIAAIQEWRRVWRTKTKFLSITGCTTPEAVVKIAVKNAHAPSVLRALDCNGKSTKAPRTEVAHYLESELLEALNKAFTFKEYDEWASTVIEKIRDIYRNKYDFCDYTYGNAQKLFNMAIKYIFSADNIDPNLPIFNVAHIPIDRVIMLAARKKLSVSIMPEAWSNTDNLEDILSYQRRLRSALPPSCPPLVWECQNWE
jgi:hypothetical protein